MALSEGDRTASAPRPRQTKPPSPPTGPRTPGFGAIPTTQTYPLKTFDGKQNAFFAQLSHCSAPCSTPPRAPALLAAAGSAESCRHATPSPPCRIGLRPPP
jgi:hypothetical protein